jgi:UDP-N-acetylmuramoyl-L-alanyl-D-glutamate--2,6-diaminopimelate ligase
MQLQQLLEGIPGATLTGDAATGVRGLAYDSRRVEPGYLFAALRGEKADGHDFVEQALIKGAVAVLSSRPAPARPRAAWVQAPDDRLALALMARNYYGKPDERMTMIGVTGTNGKTTITSLLESVLREAGLRPCLIGTVLYRYEREVVRATHTTPESLDLMRLLDRFATAGARSCAMEVSSHALALRRVAGIRYAAAVFTNLTQDHLDFHRTMEDYFEAKATLFRDLSPDAVAVLNADDPWSEKLRQRTRARVFQFGFTVRADVQLVSVLPSRTGTEIVLGVSPGIAAPQMLRLTVRSPLIGRPNGWNVAAAAAIGFALGIHPETIVRGLEAFHGVPGRFERIDLPRPFEVLIDYAHTEDAIENLLRALRELRPRRLITVFGCGGDRDRG